MFTETARHYALWLTPRSSLALHATQLNALIRSVKVIVLLPIYSIRLYLTCISAKFSYLVSIDIGTITNRFSQDIVLADSQLQIAFLNVTGGILPYIIFLALMLTPSAILTVVSQIAIAVVAAPPMSATIPLLAGVGYLI